jgi:hypothetical protein
MQHHHKFIYQIHATALHARVASPHVRSEDQTTPRCMSPPPWPASPPKTSRQHPMPEPSLLSETSESKGCHLSTLTTPKCCECVVNVASSIKSSLNQTNLFFAQFIVHRGHNHWRWTMQPHRYLVSIAVSLLMQSRFNDALI